MHMFNLSMPSSHRFVPSHWIGAAKYRVNSSTCDIRNGPSTSHHFEKLLFILLKCKKWQERRLNYQFQMFPYVYLMTNQPFLNIFQKFQCISLNFLCFDRLKIPHRLHGVPNKKSRDHLHCRGAWEIYTTNKR